MVIATFPDHSFDFLSELRRLRYLGILHFPNTSDLSPISDLQELETLSLASLPSWDASGRVLVVKSLEPIGRLAKLRHLELFGVRTPEERLSQLLKLPSLQSARFQNTRSRRPRAFMSAQV